MNDIGPYLALSINYMLVIVSLVYLWKSTAGLFSKGFWSIALFVPLIGLVFFWFIFSAPPSLLGHKRQGVHRYIAHSAKEDIDRDHGVK